MATLKEIIKALRDHLSKDANVRYPHVKRQIFGFGWIPAKHARTARRYAGLLNDLLQEMEHGNNNLNDISRKFLKLVLDYYTTVQDSTRYLPSLERFLEAVTRYQRLSAINVNAIRSLPPIPEDAAIPSEEDMNALLAEFAGQIRAAAVPRPRIARVAPRPQPQHRQEQQRRHGPEEEVKLPAAAPQQPDRPANSPAGIARELGISVQDLPRVLLEQEMAHRQLEQQRAQEERDLKAAQELAAREQGERAAHPQPRQVAVPPPEQRPAAAPIPFPPRVLAPAAQPQPAMPAPPPPPPAAVQPPQQLPPLAQRLVTRAAATLAEQQAAIASRDIFRIANCFAAAIVSNTSLVDEKVADVEANWRDSESSMHYDKKDLQRLYDKLRPRFYAKYGQQGKGIVREEILAFILGKLQDMEFPLDVPKETSQDLIAQTGAGKRLRSWEHDRELETYRKIKTELAIVLPLEQEQRALDKLKAEERKRLKEQKGVSELSKEDDARLNADPRFKLSHEKSAILKQHLPPVEKLREIQRYRTVLRCLLDEVPHDDKGRFESPFILDDMSPEAIIVLRDQGINVYGMQQGLSTWEILSSVWVAASENAGNDPKKLDAFREAIVGQLHQIQTGHDSDYPGPFAEHGGDFPTCTGGTIGKLIQAAQQVAEKEMSPPPTFSTFVIRNRDVIITKAKELVFRIIESSKALLEPLAGLVWGVHITLDAATPQQLAALEQLRTTIKTQSQAQVKEVIEQLIENILADMSSSGVQIPNPDAVYKQLHIQLEPLIFAIADRELDCIGKIHGAEFSAAEQPDVNRVMSIVSKGSYVQTAKFAWQTALYSPLRAWMEKLENTGRQLEAELAFVESAGKFMPWIADRAQASADAWEQAIGTKVPAQGRPGSFIATGYHEQTLKYEHELAQWRQAALPNSTGQMPGKAGSLFDGPALQAQAVSAVEKAMEEKGQLEEQKGQAPQIVAQSIKGSEFPLLVTSRYQGSTDVSLAALRDVQTKLKQQSEQKIEPQQFNAKELADATARLIYNMITLVDPAERGDCRLQTYLNELINEMVKQYRKAPANPKEQLERADAESFFRELMDVSPWNPSVVPMHAAVTVWKEIKTMLDRVGILQDGSMVPRLLPPSIYEETCEKVAASNVEQFVGQMAAKFHEQDEKQQDKEAKEADKAIEFGRSFSKQFHTVLTGLKGANSGQLIKSPQFQERCKNLALATFLQLAGLNELRGEHLRKSVGVLEEVIDAYMGNYRFTFGQPLPHISYKQRLNPATGGIEYFTEPATDQLSFMERLQWIGEYIFKLANTLNNPAMRDCFVSGLASIEPRVLTFPLSPNQYFVRLSLSDPTMTYLVASDSQGQGQGQVPSNIQIAGKFSYEALDAALENRHQYAPKVSPPQSYFDYQRAQRTQAKTQEKREELLRAEPQQQAVPIHTAKQEDSYMRVLR